MAALEGTTIDRYELRQLIGRGGMADVYLGHDPRFERDVAVKIFKREDEDLLRRFIREAQLMASLSNPHLMPVYDAGTSRNENVNVYYIVMPFMEGGTLRDRIRQAPLPPLEACAFLRDIADALDYMHRQGIIHRDIKSSNVLLDAEDRCYLSDFGIARTTTDTTQLTNTGNVLGTVDYIAPELFESDRRADARSDLYSLGVLLFEMVTGNLPFKAENQIAVVTMHLNKRPPSPRTFVPTLSPAVEQVIFKALEKKPELRYPSASALADSFCRAASLREPVNDLPTHVLSTSGEQRGMSQLPRESLQDAPPLRRAAPVTRKVPALNSAAGYSFEPAQRMAPTYASQATFHTRAVSSPAQSRTRIVLVLAVLALLAVLGPMAYVLLTHSFTGPSSNPTPTSGITQITPDLTATTQATNTKATQQANNATKTAVVGATGTAVAGVTATAQAQATATQQVKNATATAVAGITATAQANASATAGVVQTATAGTPAYTDPLTDKNAKTTQDAQWDQNDTCTFQQDGYHVSAKLGPLGAASFNGCREAGKSFQNFAAQVDIKVVKGFSGGLFFRSGTGLFGAYSGYLFEVDTNGHYRISRSDDFNTDMKVLQDWTTTSALKTGKVQNTLLIIARNDTFLFYINGTFIDAEVQDKTFTTGNLAFLARTAANGTDADIMYTNLKVYTLS